MSHYFPPVLINDQSVDALEEFKYLATCFDCTFFFFFTANTINVLKRSAELVSNQEVGLKRCKPEHFRESLVQKAKTLLNSSTIHNGTQRIFYDGVLTHQKSQRQISTFVDK